MSAPLDAELERRTLDAMARLRQRLDEWTDRDLARLTKWALANGYDPSTLAPRVADELFVIIEELAEESEVVARARAAGETIRRRVARN